MHTQTQQLKVHKSELNEHNLFVNEDEFINLEDEPDHNELCKREQEYFLKTIVENIDLTDHMQDALSSLQIVLAADQSIKEERTIKL